MKLWYSKEEYIGDEIISLGISSDGKCKNNKNVRKSKNTFFVVGSFGIPKGLAFSQPVYLKVLEDHSRIWVPFTDFPMPNMPIEIFQNLIDTAVIINEKMTKLKGKDFLI